MPKIVNVSNHVIGGEKLVIAAGPCAVENKDQLFRTAEKAKRAGADFLRGGAYKPRTRGGEWVGLQEKGLELLALAKEEFRLPVVTEILDPRHISLFQQYSVDLFQIGARTATTQALLQEVGAAQVPVLYKNGMNTTHKEWMGGLEHITTSRKGTENIVLCMRGRNIGNEIGRNSLDAVSMAYYIKVHEYPLIIDPSHASGMRDLVYKIAMGAVAQGADGLLIETHHDPEKAITDGPQSILPGELEILVKHAREMRAIYLEMNKEYQEHMKKVQLPARLTIYVKTTDAQEIQEIIRGIQFKPYKDQRTGILEARIDVGFLGNMVRKGFAMGNLFKMGKEEDAPYAVSVQREDSLKMLISPFSAEVVRARGGKTLDEQGQFGSRIEFIRAFPNDLIQDAFATYLKNFPEEKFIAYKK